MTYSNGSKSKWQRVSRRHRCPICDHLDWCLFTGPADNPEAVICARIESTKRVGVKGAGWLHRLRDDPFYVKRRSRTFEVETAPEPAIDFNVLADECFAAMGPHLRGLLADNLGVSESSLSQLRVGWSKRYKATTWPMSDAAGKVRGIRLRSSDGRKWSVRGGREGLFILRGGLTAAGTVVICEGASDAAALLDLDLYAIGRPSCNGGVGLLVDLVQQHHFHDAVIVADGDIPGQRGARHLASRLIGYTPGGVRIITPPDGAKDAREWCKLLQSSGISWEKARYEIKDAFEAAPVMQLHYCRKAVAR